MKLSSHDVARMCDDDQLTYVRKKKSVKQYPKKTKEGAVVRFTDEGKAVRVWASHLDSNAWTQASQFANLPFVHPHGLALMPDVHFGHGVPVGSVLPTVGAIVPAAVGVDIGCGMTACRLDVRGNQLPDHLAKLRRLIEQRVPLSSGGRHRDIPLHVSDSWTPLEDGYKWLEENHPKAVRKHAVEQLGTLGSGNHFIEVCLDEGGFVWVMLHSGSRGAGGAIGAHFIREAENRCRANGTFVHGLGWFEDKDPLFAPYTQAVEWAQRFATVNRQCMMKATLDAMEEFMGRPVIVTGEAINCHHNYVVRERHYDEDIWITRKGAIRAGLDEWGIIPSAMGQTSYIVQGRGSAESWCSCAHGAGRAMSRMAAKERFNAKDLRAQTTGVECRKDKAVVDEIPSAYKPIAQVMADQRDLVVVRHSLKALVCIKGV